MSSRPVDPLVVPDASSRPQLYSALSVDAYLQSETSFVQYEEPDEGDLTEIELRELYDNEEIDRFLDLFSSYVTEVQIPDTPEAMAGPVSSSLDLPNSLGRLHEDGEWTPVQTDREGEYFPLSDAPAPPPSGATYKSLSEEIACRYVVPLLPLPRPSAPPFTIGRLRLAIQRLYLAALPAYGPFFANLSSLAVWEDCRTSSIYCTLYWTLWWYNLLAPALVLRILFALCQRRFLPYPSLEDLRQHRAEILEAEEFGQQVSARLSATSSSMTEIWRLFKLFEKKKKNKVKKTKEKVKDKGFVASSESLNEDLAGPGDEQSATVLDDADDDAEEAKDVKRLVLYSLDQVADLHERIRNIFIWRKPASSTKYGFALLAVFFITLLPAKYLSKLVFFILGFAYWHIVPVISSLPKAERKRLPPPFDDVPTDAEYAMELISQRVAAGLEVKPSRLTRNKKKQQSTDNLARTTENGTMHKNSNSQGSGDNNVDWKKWGNRVAFGKSAVNDLRRLKPGKGFPIPEVWPPHNPIIPGAVGIGQSQLEIETHTYPCQHSSSPGLITLTSKTLFFTPLMSQNAKLVIPLSAVKGVKKAGLLKGVQIRWTDSSDGNKEQREDKFLWVGSRDELFARLVGTDGRRWMTV